ncbi:MAG: PQQ-dependent sugar dehydrogenase [Salinibacterium sp.]|nr:PQQ-dependent sugar dehydrogenase [Salinibacterium sp.]
MKLVAIGTVALLLAGCAATPTPHDTPSPGTIEIITGLDSPWSMVRLASGSTLISERDTGTITELTPDGVLRVAAHVAGVVSGGEGGLLGLEVADGFLYAYYTAADDNRVERFALDGGAGSYSLGAGTVILDGLAKARNHDGGRIKIGPDGDLYVTVGDAGDPDRAQDLLSPNGKILRIHTDGSIPADNPFPGSPVYSYGHRNPQGIAWDDNGQLWAAEFGQDTWDEFNRIEAGGNYGWPIVEGIANRTGFIDPILQWSTDQASPSGLAFADGGFFLASLRGQRIWAIDPNGPSIVARPTLVATYGRLRDVIPGPDGTVWILTNNTDGRGDPRPGDDRIIQVPTNVLIRG